MKKLIPILLFSVLATAGSHAETPGSEAGKSGQSTGPGIPVRIVSLCFAPGKSLEEIAEIVDAEGTKGVDLVCLPEAWRGQTVPETLDGETITSMAKLAKKHQCYIVSPIDRREGDLRLNSSVLIDRSGKVVCVYDKVFPYWSEFDIDPPVAPAQRDVQVYDADFGRIGFSICYDAKFPEVFQRLRDKRAELVVWSSAYSGYTELCAFALQHHYYIVTSTYTRDCVVYDKTGALLLDETGEGDITVARFTLDMDRRIFHYNFNRDKREKLLRGRGGRHHAGRRHAP